MHSSLYLFIVVNLSKNICSFFQDFELYGETANLQYFLVLFQTGQRSSGECSLYQRHIWLKGAIEHTAKSWLKKFRSDDESPEDGMRSEWPSNVSSEQQRALLNANPDSTVRDIAAEKDLAPVTIFSHSKPMSKSKNLNKWVLRELCKNKKIRSLSTMFLLRNKNDPFLYLNVTYDENWII